jgi:hypothetical protein
MCVNGCCGCCCNDDEGSIDDLPIVNGVIDFRKVSRGCCRDFYCLIVMILAIIGLIVIFGVGFTKGNPAKFYHPLNNEFFFLLYDFMILIVANFAEWMKSLKKGLIYFILI